MKIYIRILFALVWFLTGSCFFCEGADATSPSASTQAKNLPASTPYAVTGRDANSRVWQRTVYERDASGQPVPKVHQYTEIASGMHYQDATGQWVESKEVIETYATGAIARQGQYQVIFANNLNTAGSIDLQTPDGKRIRSNILGLMYHDTSTDDAVLIAQIQDSTGELIAGNQVLYPNAFEGVKADVRYTYKKGRFEQDVILREQPPTPESLGLNPDTTEIEVMTEFINPVAARIVDGSSDEEIDWGTMRIGRGKAFDLESAATPQSRTAVQKQYVNVQGRQILLEKVQAQIIRPALAKLPLQSSLQKRSQFMLAKGCVLPRPPLAQVTEKPIKLALLAPSNKGYVLDYVTVNTSTSNYTFQGNQTYYVTSYETLSGTTTIEGGAVIKFPRDASASPSLDMYDNWVCKTSRYHPAVFTVEDDDTVGEQISGSTGAPVIPTNGDSYFLVLDSATNASVNNLRFCYAQYGLTPDWAGPVDVWDCQFVNCQYAIDNWTATGFRLHNVLFARCQAAAAFETGSGGFVGENITADVVNLISTNTYAGAVQLTNSIILSSDSSFRAYSTSTNSSVINPAGAIFQAVGGAGYYLTNGSPYRNAGTTNINPALLADLQQTTTYPPLVFDSVTVTNDTSFSPQVQRDIDAPDLGYHYDPLDYAFTSVNVPAGTNVIFAAGTAAAWFSPYVSSPPGWDVGAACGLALHEGSSATFNGTATSPCQFVQHQTVQEGGNAVWMTGYLGGIANRGNFDESKPAILTATFTHFSHLAEGASHYRDGESGESLKVRMHHCEFLGDMGGYGLFATYTNCLFECMTFWQGTGVSTPYEIFRNCTFHEGSVGFTHWEGGAPYWYTSVRDCAFEGTTFSIDDPFGVNTNYADYDFNAYLSGVAQMVPSGSNNITVTNFNWQGSWLGNYYLPTDSALINMGDTTADQVGLYHFTTQTNQVKEANSMVDIGYHYVATDAYGNPIDTDGDGIPDYLEDLNGNGIQDNGEVPIGITMENPSAGALVY